MKHEPIISFERAVCRCGQMPGIWRQDGEQIGIFTLRSHEVWREHVTSAAGEPETLFDLRESVPEAIGLFS